MKLSTERVDPERRRPYAVLIGLECTQGIQAARVLARRGVPVIALASDPHHPFCRTNVCEEIVYADTDGDGLIPALQALGRRLDREAVLFPCEDTSVALVSRHRERLAPWYRIVLPAADVIDLLIDKDSFYEYALEHGVPIPPTWFLRSRGDAERAANELTFPAILKPSFRSTTWGLHTCLKAFKIDRPEELLNTYDRYRAWADLLIAQAWIEGPAVNHYTCNCYFDAHSEPLVTFVSRKLRQWPHETGQGCLGEECRNDFVRDETVRLFKTLRYRGLGYLEMKLDARTGKYFIIEPNVGRPTGRSATAEAAGVELLYTMYCDALGWPLPPNREQIYTGVKWVHFRRDCQSAVHLWRRGELTGWEWWRSLRGRKTYAMFSWRDLGPSLSSVKKAARVLLSSREREKRGLGPFVITAKHHRSRAS
jgi:D-aspartate ligase